MGEPAAEGSVVAARGSEVAARVVEATEAEVRAAAARVEAGLAAVVTEAAGRGVEVRAGVAKEEEEMVAEV